LVIGVIADRGARAVGGRQWAQTALRVVCDVAMGERPLTIQAQ
jgi:hypothetical protein